MPDRSGIRRAPGGHPIISLIISLDRRNAIR